MENYYGKVQKGKAVNEYERVSVKKKRDSKFIEIVPVIGVLELFTSLINKPKGQGRQKPQQQKDLEQLEKQVKEETEKEQQQEYEEQKQEQALEKGQQEDKKSQEKKKLMAFTQEYDNI